MNIAQLLHVLRHWNMFVTCCTGETRWTNTAPLSNTHIVLFLMWWNKLLWQYDNSLIISFIEMNFDFLPKREVFGNTLSASLRYLSIQITVFLLFHCLFCVHITRAVLVPHHHHHHHLQPRFFFFPSCLGGRRSPLIPPPWFVPARRPNGPLLHLRERLSFICLRDAREPQ